MSKDVKIELFLRQYVRQWSGVPKNASEVHRDLTRLYGPNILKKTRRYAMGCSQKFAEDKMAIGVSVTKKDGKSSVLIEETVFTLIRSQDLANLEECYAIVCSVAVNFPDIFATTRLTMIEDSGIKAI